MIQKLLLSIQMIRKMFTKNIDEYNPGKKRKILIVFDDVIADMINKKTKFNSDSTIYLRQKIKHLFCFYYTIIF